MTIDSRLHRIVAAQPYPLLFATIGGAHLYGFPSPESDYDLRGAHVLPLDTVVGLEVRDEKSSKDACSTSPRPSPHRMRRGRALEMDIGGSRRSHRTRQRKAVVRQSTGR